ncbi:hypothetical protein ACEPAI_2201 [Sanghuangporus weigelae]
MHYVSNDWTLEERLITFEEITGAHSGENLAAIVWSTVEMYGLKNKLIAINCDNASNNDTMMQHLEAHMRDDGIMSFSADKAQMRCMPHIVHLAAMKLLEVIGAAKGINEQTRNYQSDINPPGEDEEVMREDEPEDDDTTDMLTSIAKLRKLVHIIRDSAQHRQDWRKHLVTIQKEISENTKDETLMLILDVPTRWSSTHQMLNCALRFQHAIDVFSTRRELRQHELDEEDWLSIQKVADWLIVFRHATTDMSSTKKAALSLAFGYFLVLQNKIRSIIDELPANIAPQLKRGLIAAHEKLVEYLFCFTVSPYYLWASLLDLRISYDKLCEIAQGDPTLLKTIKDSKAKLYDFFNDKYTTRQQELPTNNAEQSLSKMRTNDLAILLYGTEQHTQHDELKEFFSMPRHSSLFEIDTIEWWAAHRVQFPQLLRLARDIHCIPGSAVAVERVFSGGRDTIALRRASLKPGTIGRLMILKYALQASHKQ